MTRLFVYLVLSFGAVQLILNANGTLTKIVDGSSVSILDFPYQVSLQHGRTHHCGASIISNRWILTAAHCIEFQMKVAGLYVYAGSSNLKRYGIRKAIKSVHRHPHFEAHSLDYDFALLQLTKPFRFDDTLRSIELPKQSERFEDGTMCVVSGWGHTGIRYPFTLQAVNIPLVNQEACDALHVLEFPILESMICAGYLEGTKNACYGDSGGPLVCDNRLVGVVSWGRHCPSSGAPVVYGQVSKIVEWIESFINTNASVSMT